MNRVFSQSVGVLAAVCAFGVLAGAAATSAIAAPTPQQVNVGQKVGLNFRTIDGKSVGGKELKGKVAVLEFWATSCPVCMGHMPQMKKLTEEYGPKGVQLIGIGMDPTADALKPVIKEKEITWPQVHDAGDALQRRYGVNATPTLFIVGPDSVVRWRGDIDELPKALDEVLEKHPPVLKAPKADAKQADAGSPPESQGADAAPAAAKERPADPAAKAKAALSIAKSYATTGRKEAAIKRYEAVVKDFPNTEYAKTAKAEIEKLKK